MAAYLLSTAPFVSYRESPDLELEFELEKLANGGLDRLRTGNSAKETVFFNRNYNSFGVVGGSMISDVERISKRLIASHLMDPNSQLLILHSSNNSIPNPCTLLDFTNTSKAKVFISPRNPASVLSSYRREGMSVEPLLFDEETISLYHILAMFTPPTSLQSGNKILNLVQYILSQLNEPFDLQKFIELVDREHWEEEAATFMATRQTLLNMLLSSSGSKRKAAQPQSLIVDMSDPVLFSTDLDNVLMDMALRQFLLPSNGGRKMLVVNASQEYLRPGTILAQHLQRLGCQGNQRATSVLMTTTEPPTLTVPCDYVLLGRCDFPQWSIPLQRLLLQSDTSFARSPLAPDEVLVMSPTSLRVRGKSLTGEAGGRWGLNPVVLDLAELALPRSYFLKNLRQSQQTDIWEDVSSEQEEESATPPARSPAPYQDEPTNPVIVQNEVGPFVPDEVGPEVSQGNTVGNVGEDTSGVMSDSSIEIPQTTIPTEERIRALLAAIEATKHTGSNRVKSGKSSKSRNGRRKSK